MISKRKKERERERERRERESTNFSESGIRVEYAVCFPERIETFWIRHIIYSKLGVESVANFLN